jgi:hypothetical protein
MQKITSPRGYYWLFFVALLYCVVSLATIREFLVPALFPFSKNGIIPGDASYYDAIAQDMSQKIQAVGFSAFELHPNGQGAAGIVSIIYWATDRTSIGVILLNSILHAASVVLLSKIVRLWFTKRVAILSTIPLLVSPYMMLWFSQINKESFALFGSLAITYGLTSIVCASEKTTARSLAVSTLLGVAGVVVVWTVRPYINQALMPVAVTLMSFALIARLTKFKKHQLQSTFLVFMSYLAVTFSLIHFDKGAASDDTIESFFVFKNSGSTLGNQAERINSLEVSEKCLNNISENEWKDAEFLHRYINDRLKAMMGQRCMIFTILETHTDPTTLKSIVDINILPKSSVEAISYLPKAALLGFFSPFPHQWYLTNDGQISLFYLVASVETFLLYIFAPCLIWWSTRQRLYLIAIPISISLAVMTLYGMAIPFLGAMYRYRYPWWSIVFALCFAAFISLICNRSPWKVSTSKSNPRPNPS